MVWWNVSDLNRCFVASTNDQMGTSGQHVPWILLQNSANTKKSAVLFKIDTLTNVSTNNNIFRFYANPAVTAAGTPLSPVNLNIQTPLTPPSSLVSFKPTVSDNGSFMFNVVAGPVQTVLNGLEYPIVVQPGNKLLVTMRSNTSNVTGCVNLWWFE